MQQIAESLARAVYQLAHLDECKPARPLDLAHRVLGKASIRYDARLGVPGMIVPIRGKWRLFLRPDLTQRRLAHVVGHELGHWICQREGLDDPEDLCDAIGAAIVAPRPSFLARLAKAGPRLRRLAWAYETSESLVALRYAEVTAAPLALVTPEAMRVRGEYDWPPERELRELARSGGGSGLRAVRLLDDPRRIALTSCDRLTA